MPAADVWEEIVEVSVHTPTGSLRLESLEQGPVDGLELLSPAGPGWYRMRVHAHGHNIDRDTTGSGPVEDFLLLTWPAPRADADIVRKSGRMEPDLAHTAGAPRPRPLAALRSEEQETLRQRLLRK